MLPDDRSAFVLEGFAVQTDNSVSLPVQICADHLKRLGTTQDLALRHSERDSDVAGGLTLHPLEDRTGADATQGRTNGILDGSIDCAIRWRGTPANRSDMRDTEATLQAISGLMEVHGRDYRRPRRLGLEVASFAAGILATQGLMAAMIGNCRGHRIRRVETSVLHAALLFMNHHLALATCEDRIPLPPDAPACGPPFPTADGHAVELEVLTFDSWMAFGGRLGVEPAEMKRAWSPFVYRYLTAHCALPTAICEATRGHSLAELHRIATECGVALCRVRDYSEVLAEQASHESTANRQTGGQFSQPAPWSLTAGNTPVDRGHPVDSVGRGPLSGLQVIECTSRLQGPLAGQLLRMLGAEVVKVEPPGGDFTRYSPPLAGTLGAAYLAYNRGKDVVEIDYKLPAGRAELRDRISAADVFLHNWRTGRAEQLGLDFQSLVATHPGLIHAHASGWGDIDPEPSPFTGDCLVQAHAACGDGLNPVDEPPFPSRITLIDTLGGLLACEGILAGICLRERTGSGCQVKTSLFAAAMALQGSVLDDLQRGQETQRCHGRPRWSVLDSPLQTADGFLQVVAEDEISRQRLFEVCNLRVGAGEIPSQECVVERFLSRPAAEWEAMLRQAGVYAVVVQSYLADLPQNPRMVDLLDRIDNTCRVPSAPWQFKN